MREWERQKREREERNFQRDLKNEKKRLKKKDARKKQKTKGTGNDKADLSKESSDSEGKHNDEKMIPSHTPSDVVSGQDETHLNKSKTI
jgi:hypothetical protein